MLVGYARVSTVDQDTALQLDAFARASVLRVQLWMCVASAPISLASGLVPPAIVSARSISFANCIAAPFLVFSVVYLYCYCQTR